jgi:hypothetical protein
LSTGFALFCAKKIVFFPVFLRFLKKWSCFKAREEFWNSLRYRRLSQNLIWAHFLLRKKLRLVGGFVYPSVEFA